MNRQNTIGGTPLDIAPEEIWMYIFDLLETNNLVRASLSCRSFSKILRGKKVTFLFGNVLPIIATSLDLDSLLACRGVSKQWRAETDMFLASGGLTHMTDLEDETGQKTNAARYLCPTLAFNVETMAQFHQSMKDHSTNPFVGRTVELNLKEGDFGPVVKDTVQLFIHTFGQHIWHFEYDDRSEPENIENIMTLDGVYGFFKNIAGAMPNLRSLSFTIFSIKNSRQGPEDEIQGVNPLMDLMAASPLPKLPFLEMMNLDFGESLSHNLREVSLHCPIQCEKIYQNIVWTYGHQLKRLEIQWYYWNPYFRMENLTELRLYYFESNKSLEWIQNYVLSSRSPSTKVSLPSLIRLQIDFGYYKVDINCLMTLLQKIREICGRFEILSLLLYIPLQFVTAEGVGKYVDRNILFAQKPVDYDCEVEWLRQKVTECVEEVKQTYHYVDE